MKTLITTVLFVLLINFMLTAQNENIKIEKSNDTTSSRYDKILKYFLTEKIEVKQLFKIDFFQIAYRRLNFDYERRLTNNSSIEIEGMSSLITPILIFPELNIDEKTFIYNFNLNSDYKYYYNIKKRNLNGKNTNGFSANYFSVGLSAYLNFYDNSYYRVYDDGTLTPKFDDPSFHQHEDVQWIFRKHDPRENTVFVKIGYGLQRRIGNIGYVSTDIKFGIGTNKDFNCLYILPEINIKAGFAISSFKRR